MEENPMEQTGILRWLKFRIKKIRMYFRKQANEEEWEEDAAEGNPFLPQLRWILEQVLEKYGMDYRIFRPLLLDTDTPPESMLEEDDVALVLEQISSDLNFLRIATDRPAYFASYIDRMYEDTGLVVQTEAQEEISLDGVNVILDMERKGNCHYRYMKEGILYIPLYKRPWSQVKMMQNLDISIPIGYNTVIVKGR
ncbi:MAG: hypothetical protein HFH49_12250 [Lachnospiraceae bacterium]|nr:hypothetical protein [Lachnospiraceae bacterium]